MKSLDLPPIWTLLSVGLVWVVARLLPDWRIDFAGQGILALAVLAGALALTFLALREMSRAQSTAIPRQKPDALVTGGVFSRSRNPIYLGGLMVIAAAIIWLGAWLALPLLWVFIRVIERRFILAEEAGLRAAFGQEFEDWANNTRRWL